MQESEYSINTDIRPQLARLQMMALVAAVVGVVLCVLSVIISPEIGLKRFFQSYLFAYLFWWGVTTGSLGLLMLHHVVGGGWGFIIRRPLEAGTRLLPFVALLFVPIILGIPALYEWSHPEAAHDKVLAAKAAYLNVPSFIVRAVVYFAIWMILAFILNKWGRTQDERSDPAVTHRLNLLSAPGLILFVLTITFAAVDWVMSIEPHWFSSIIGLLYVVMQGLSTLALMLVLVAFTVGGKPILDEVPRGYFRDLGNLLLAFGLLWAYMSFSQVLIIYSGNTAEEVPWYVHRTTGGWEWVARTLIPFHFALPFLVLLIGSDIKRKPGRLAKVALFILLMRFVDVMWWVVPTFRQDQISFSFSDLGAPLALGGLWLALWAWQMKGRALVPLHDPRLEGSWPVPQGEHGEVVGHG